MVKDKKQHSSSLYQTQRNCGICNILPTAEKSIANKKFVDFDITP
jgi:hypothetical protein